MAADLFETDARFRGLVARASERTGADLERICRRGPERELTRTRYLQPLLVCVSLGYARHLAERGVVPAIVAGHSVGEISALAAAEVVSFEEAVDIAAQRGECMETAASKLPGGMIAVLNPEREKLLQWLQETRPCERLVVANDNAPGQLVLSGELAALNEACEAVARERLGTCRRLPVSGPWHSPWMKEAQERLQSWLQTICFRPPRVPILMNASALPETDPERIRRLMLDSLTAPVLWRTAMERLRALQPRALFEVGPGRVLSGLARANGFGDETPVWKVNNLRGVELAVRSSGASPSSGFTSRARPE